MRGRGDASMPPLFRISFVVKQSAFHAKAVQANNPIPWVKCASDEIANY